MPVMVPIMLPRPRLMSMKKNMTDQKGLAGKWVMASVKAMKARPVPCTDCRGQWVRKQEKDANLFSPMEVYSSGGHLGSNLCFAKCLFDGAGVQP